MVLASTMLLAAASFIKGWRACDVTSSLFGAVGDGLAKDTDAIRTALRQCDEVVLPAGRSFLTAPLNLTSNQVTAAIPLRLFSVQRMFSGVAASCDGPL